MRKLTILLGLSAWVAMTAVAHADDKKTKKADKSEVKEASADAAGAKGGVTKDKDGVRHDPKGIKGISPYVELINKGDRAFVARDFDGAIATYREAIQLDPQNALGHYRVGETQLIKGDMKEADASFVSGLRFVGKDGTLKGKLIFALADLRERQKNNDEAIARWKDYAQNAADEKEAVTYPATATERGVRNEAWKTALADGAAVKERIAKRLKEAEEAARKSAADPKNK